MSLKLDRINVEVCSLLAWRHVILIASCFVRNNPVHTYYNILKCHFYIRGLNRSLFVIWSLASSFLLNPVFIAKLNTSSSYKSNMQVFIKLLVRTKHTLFF